jgi:hypothetical protein
MTSTNVLFTNKDIKLIEDNLARLQEEAEKLAVQNLEKPLDVQKRIIDTIVDFIITKKRKVYGGYAMNELLKEVDENLRIYEVGSVNDVDFYSYDPINDIIDLSNILHKMNVGDVRAREAVHSDTYSIFVDDKNYCDISYVPRNIFNKMPFKNSKNGLILIHPHFMWIDYLRMLTDPVGSWFRIEKSIKRFAILQNTFPFPKNLSQFKIDDEIVEVEIGLKTIFNFIDGRDTVMQVGSYAYNYLLSESGINKQSGGAKNKRTSIVSNNRTSNEKLKFIDVTHYEMISVDYEKDAKDLINLLKKQFPDEPNMIVCVEHYPFFQFTGFHVNIYCNDYLIATVYDNHHKCYPSKLVQTKFFSKNENKHFTTKGKLRLGTFSVILMYALINIQRARVEENESDKQTYYAFTSQIIHMRNYFLDNSGKSILENTLFQEMCTECIGKSISSFREKRLRIEKNKKEGRRLTFNYNPEQTLLKRPQLLFPNSSGQPINNQKNMILNICKIKNNDNNSDSDSDSDNDNDNDSNNSDNSKNKLSE